MRSCWIGSHSLQASGYHPFLCLPSHTHSHSYRGEGERMAIALVSVPTPHQTLCTQRSYTKGNSWFHSSTTTLIKYPSKPAIIPICSSSTSSTSVVEDGPPPPSSDALPATEDVDKLPLSGCKGCGREEIEKGCNGEGRIQGGIATVPGFGWWPIKAYRPCPGFLASGGRYRRQGQSMDEVAFGREQKETTRNQ